MPGECDTLTERDVRVPHSSVLACCACVTRWAGGAGAGDVAAPGRKAWGELGLSLGLSLGRAGRVLVMQSWLMEIRHRDVHPAVHPDAYVAPTAVLSGEVRVGPGSCVLHGAVLTADGGPVDVGANCVIMEHAVLRGTARHPRPVRQARSGRAWRKPAGFSRSCSAPTRPPTGGSRCGPRCAATPGRWRAAIMATSCCPDIRQRRDHHLTPNSLLRRGPSCPSTGSPVGFDHRE